MAAVGSLWIGAQLSPLERACIQSFLRRGHEFHLYCYRAIGNVPDGCRILDAAVILPQSRVITYARGPGKGSVSLFSNQFRYKLLHDVGGWWVDMDMYCLSDRLPDSGVVLAREDQDGLNCAIMRFPRGHAALREGYEECLGRGDDVEWGDTGPRLLTRLAAKHELGDNIFPESVFYPIHFTHFWTALDPRRTRFAAEKIQGAACVHLWNEALRRLGIDKNVMPPRGSLLWNLYDWTIGTQEFTHEYVLAPSCGPESLDLRVVPRQADA